MLQTRTFEGIQSIEAATWDALTEGYPFASWDWFHFGEKVLGSKADYVLVYESDLPVAGAAFFTRRKEQLVVPSKIAQLFWRKFLSYRPLLVCRTAPLTRSKGIFLPQGDQRDHALEMINAAALNLARQKKTSFLFFDYLRLSDVEAENWNAYFLKISEFYDPSTRMTLEWATFDEYLGSLKSSWRSSYRRNIKRAGEEGIVVQTHSQIIDLDESLALIRQVEKHHHQYPEPYARQVLENISMVDFAWFTAHIDKQLVGCCLMLEDRNTLTCEPVLLGLDYNARYAYFSIMYAMIQYAIEDSPATTFIGGSGAYDFKLAFGFELDYQNNMILAASSRLLQRVIHRFM